MRKVSTLRAVQPKYLDNDESLPRIHELVADNDKVPFEYTGLMDLHIGVILPRLGEQRKPLMPKSRNSRIERRTSLDTRDVILEENTSVKQVRNSTKGTKNQTDDHNTDTVRYSGTAGSEIRSLPRPKLHQSVSLPLFDRQKPSKESQDTLSPLKGSPLTRRNSRRPSEGSHDALSPIEGSHLARKNSRRPSEESQDTLYPLEENPLARRNSRRSSEVSQGALSPMEGSPVTRRSCRRPSEISHGELSPSQGSPCLLTRRCSIRPATPTVRSRTHSEEHIKFNSWMEITDESTATKGSETPASNSELQSYNRDKDEGFPRIFAENPQEKDAFDKDADRTENLPGNLRMDAQCFQQWIVEQRAF